MHLLASFILKFPDADGVSFLWKVSNWSNVCAHGEAASQHFWKSERFLSVLYFVRFVHHYNH